MDNGTVQSTYDALTMRIHVCRQTLLHMHTYIQYTCAACFHIYIHTICMAVYIMIVFRIPCRKWVCNCSNTIILEYNICNPLPLSMYIYKYTHTYIHKKYVCLQLPTRTVLYTHMCIYIDRKRCVNMKTHMGIYVYI